MAELCLIPEADRNDGTLDPEADRNGGTLDPEADRNGGTLDPEPYKNCGTHQRIDKVWSLDFFSIIFLNVLYSRS
jgi:hypothetical protein